MNPRAETVLWSRDGTEIYAAFDRIFDCRRHGWANLQSMHVNLPFAGDLEFARLHAAIRVLLPLIPALAASSPCADGRLQPELDHRLEVYRTHADAVPEVVGGMVPESVTSRRDYEERVLQPMYRAIAPRDPQGTLQQEWLNARGAIARFDRSAIEIRLCDTQEAPRADVAIAAAIASVAQALFEERWARYEAQRTLATPVLAATLRACMRDADRATIDDPALCAVLGVPRACTAGEAWASLIGRCESAIAALEPDASAVLAHIQAHGPLARRIVSALRGRTERAALRDVYADLCACLASGALFSPS
jgi:carboxylate-amine ligase